MRPGWINVVFTIGLPFGVSLALSGCNFVHGAVDSLGHRYSAIVEWVSVDRSEPEASDIKNKADTSLDRRAAAIIASQQTKRPLWPKTEDPASSSTSASGQELSRANSSSQDLAVMTSDQEDPTIALRRVPSRRPSTEETGPLIWVQVAAARNEADARRAWERVQTNHGATLAGMDPHFARAETSKGIIYRIRTGPFQSRGEADRFCIRLNERGAICFVVAV
jgi:cell division septation protein DedD